jgi:hypothetical protein
MSNPVEFIGPARAQKVLKRALRRLELGAPLGKPCVVVWKPMSYSGWAELKKRSQFYIVVSRTNCEDCALETLIHEWAHCRHPRAGAGKRWSQRRWGEEYAKCYEVAQGGH